MSEVNLKRGESVEKALKKLKKKLLKEGTLDKARSKKYYEKPTQARYKKEAKYIQKLKSKEERDYWS
jgi:small subunit ribosomal protein S21